MRNTVYVIDGKKKCCACGIVLCVSHFNFSKHTHSGYRSQCKSCMKKQRNDRKDYYKKWRTSEERLAWYRNYRKENYNPVVVKARNLINRAVKYGRIERMPCEVCGTTDRIHAHHDDYAFPLVVRWLCVAHHSQWHMENGEGKNAS